MEKEKNLNEIQNNFKEYDQSQLYWDVIHINELLEEEHPARLLNKIVETLDLTCLYLEHSKEGNSPYHPKMMLKVLFYGYYTGLLSCRRIWDAVKYRADFIYLSAGQVPNFRTINSFRMRHLKNLPDIFSQIVLLCVELDLVGFEYLAIDGETIKANANFQKNKSLSIINEEIEELSMQIGKVLEKDLEDNESEEVKDWQKSKITKMEKKYEKLEEMRKKLEILAKKKIEKQKNRELKVEEAKPRGREKDPQKIRINLTDSESPILQHKDGRTLPSYQHQTAGDSKYGISCAIQTTRRPDHPSDLLPLVDEAKKNTMQVFKKILADCAFGSLGVFKRIKEERDEDFYVPDERYKIRKTKKDKAGKFKQEEFKYDKNGNLYCPAKKIMEYIGQYKMDNTKKDIHKGIDCENCDIQYKCTDAKKRIVTIDIRTNCRKEMWKKLDSDRGKYHYLKRGPIIENIHGDDQKNRGWIQHHLRGYEKAKGEFILMRIASNLRKMVKYGDLQLLKT